LVCGCGPPRRRAKLSQEALAEKIGRASESISNIERGVQLPNIETLAGENI
jgi:DNA-binding XRE family transcriptional regulator